jgi:hypothetical protein
MIDRVTANAFGFDTDTENLIPGRTLPEEWEEAARGTYEILPHKNLRERQYMNNPLIVLPEYSGDFLDKLRNRTAGDEDNLKDFSSPEDMLKHQEHAFPRDMVDEFYEMSRPGEGAGSDDLKHYHDRSWDENDAPEMSEDKILKLLKPKFPLEIPCKETLFHSANRVASAFLCRSSGPDPQMVIANHLLELCPLDLELSIPDDVRTASSMRFAILMQDLEKSLIYTKSKGWRPPNKGEVSAMMDQANSKPWIYRWVFNTTSGKGGTYKTIFQFIPSGNMVDLRKLHVRVTCSCNSWLYWGAQYNAFKDNYLEGPIHPKLSPPDVRDPNGKFLVCKHVLKVIDVINSKRLIKPMLLKGQPPSQQRRLEKERAKFLKSIKAPPDIVVLPVEKSEKLRIPPKLEYVAEDPKMVPIIEKWETMSPLKRKNTIQNLETPDEIAYMSHRFPDTATKWVALKLRDMIRHEKDAKERLHEEELLRGII